MGRRILLLCYFFIISAFGFDGIFEYPKGFVEYPHWMEKLSHEDVPPELFVLTDEVTYALKFGKPIVALESTVISHGMCLTTCNLLKDRDALSTKFGNRNRN